MKKILLAMLQALPVLVLAQQKTDAIKLKNGKTIVGHIYKMEGGGISIAKEKDSMTYMADEIQSIQFCSNGETKNPCAVAGGSAAGTESGAASSGSSTSKSSSTNASTFSSFNKEVNPDLAFDKSDTEKGTVVFACNMCGGKGTLLIRGDNEYSTSSAKYSFTMKEDEHFFVFAAKLVPGEYKWIYTDTNKNQAKGNLIINKGTKQKITLFEE